MFLKPLQLIKNNMEKILISFSGGRTSALMAKLLMESPKGYSGEKLVVFANTGKEKEETLEFVDKCDKEFNLNVVWLEAKVNKEKGKGTSYRIVDFKTASRNGEPFEAVISKYGLPSKLYRHCTRELKEVPIHKYAKKILGKEYKTAIGIRADEPHRISNNKKYVYPLYTMGFTEEIVRSWWSRQDFDLGIKDYQGNCDICFLKSKRKKLTILSETPELAVWWDKMEQKYNSEFQSKFDELRNLSIQDLLHLSQLPFSKAIDKQELRTNQASLFEPEYDLEYDCFCKSN
jgi:3'-phosphoadenosine 5'-phosphosulfate sulfotransferase (PAPS reductase)/FAD synthetase